MSFKNNIVPIFAIMTMVLCIIIISKLPKQSNDHISRHLDFSKACGSDNHLYYIMWSDEIIPALNDDGKPIACIYKKGD